MSVSGTSEVKEDDEDYDPTQDYYHRYNVGGVVWDVV